jgi:hypothetical protein
LARCPCIHHDRSIRWMRDCITPTGTYASQNYESAVALQDGRVHCSLNINTETGRLSCRRPNLQNQPALEKDRYFIRKAFRAQVRCLLCVQFLWTIFHLPNACTVCLLFAHINSRMSYLQVSCLSWGARSL